MQVNQQSTEDSHERIVYEKLKASLARNGVQRQILLIPEIVEMDEATVERLLARADELAAFGLAIESFGPGAVAVRETPSLLGKTNAGGLLRDLSEHMCAGAISFARVRRLYYGAADPKGGAVESGVRFFASPTCHHAPDVYSGVGESEAARLLREFFRERR